MTSRGDDPQRVLGGDEGLRVTDDPCILGLFSKNLSKHAWIEFYTATALHPCHPHQLVVFRRDVPYFQPWSTGFFSMAEMRM